jgi:hypothetical protein
MLEVQTDACMNGPHPTLYNNRASSAARPSRVMNNFLRRRISYVLAPLSEIRSIESMLRAASFQLSSNCSQSINHNQLESQH